MIMTEQHLVKEKGLSEDDFVVKSRLEILERFVKVGGRDRHRRERQAVLGFEP